MTNHIVLKKELSSALLAELGGDAHLRDIRLPLFGWRDPDEDVGRVECLLGGVATFRDRRPVEDTPSWRAALAMRRRPARAVSHIKVLPCPAGRQSCRPRAGRSRAWPRAGRASHRSASPPAALRAPRRYIAQATRRRKTNRRACPLHASLGSLAGPDIRPPVCAIPVRRVR